MKYEFKMRGAVSISRISEEKYLPMVIWKRSGGLRGSFSVQRGLISFLGLSAGRDRCLKKNKRIIIIGICFDCQQ